ncbi:MAG: gfo/Idh/MocA family oxidoreductase [Candidatus Latescibacteria bacterium]|nr:gfo/Idh/MocA family oxidoreductase [Candidatus Latescibacterota bacterium]
MSRETLRIGLIGVGLIGKGHLRKYREIDAAQVVALADLDQDELARVAAEFDVADTYTDYKELLQRDDIDAVDVCLHNNLHAPVTIAALEAGKHVYCEKPIAGSYADGQAMLAAAAATGHHLSVQLANVFARETRVARRLIDEGRLGQVYHARSTGYRRRGRPFVDGYGTAQFVRRDAAGGGALFDMGVYHIARMLYLLGPPAIERISGKIYQETGMDENRRQQSGYDVEELATGLVRLGGGATLDITEAWAIHLDPFEGSFIVGSEGGVRLDPFSYHTTVADMDMDATFNIDAASRRWHSLGDTEDAYDSPQQHWIAALQGRVELLPTAELALQTMLISEGIYLSDRLGREVTAAEVAAESRSTALDV